MKSVPPSYLEDSKFSLVENNMKVPARIIPGEEIVTMHGFPACMIFNLGLALAIDSRRRRIERIKYCVYDSNRFDAFAFRYNDSGIIVISLGVVHACFSIAYATLATTELADSYSLSAKPVITLENYAQIARLEETVLPDIPFDAKRALVAYQLASMSLNAIGFHEAAHIVNGHLRFTQENEIIAKRSNVSKALEYDADCYAVEALVNFVRTANSRGGRKRVTDMIDIIKLSAFAAALPFTIFNPAGIVITPDIEARAETHPAFGHRVWNAFMVARELFVRGQVSSETTEQLIGDLLWQLLRAVSMATGSNPSFSSGALIEELNARNASLGQFIETWAEIRPALAELKIGRGELAPAQVRNPELEVISAIADNAPINLLGS